MRRASLLLVAAAGACAFLAHALAQNALDSNLQSGSAGVNAARQRPVMAPEIYTYNSVTGETEYNEANAFAQPVYRLSRMPGSYAAYHRDTVRPTSARDGVYTLNRSTGSYQYNPYNAFASPTYNPRQSYTPPPRSYGATRTPTASYGSQPTGTTRASSLAMPSYRVR